MGKADGIVSSAVFSVSSMTLTETILARASGRPRVQPGDNVWVNTDILLTHDVCGPGTIGVFHREFGRDAKVWDRDKIVIIPDHYIFTADSMSNRNVDILRTFVREQGLRYFYDVIDDPEGAWKFDASRGQLKRQYASSFAGVCHTALPEKGHARPGEVLFGTDSHTCMAGAFGEFATGIGNTDAGFIMGTGKLLVKVPETMRFHLDGELPKGVMAKDVILHVIGEIGFDGATYRAMQWDGPGAGSLSMDDRMTIANMAIEAGGKNGIFAADQKTFDYVNARIAANGTKVRLPARRGRGGPEVRLRPGVRPFQAGADRRHAPEPGQPRVGQDARATSRWTARTSAVARVASSAISWRSRRSSRGARWPSIRSACPRRRRWSMNSTRFSGASAACGRSWRTRA